MRHQLAGKSGIQVLSAIPLLLAIAISTSACATQTVTESNFLSVYKFEHESSGEEYYPYVVTGWYYGDAEFRLYPSQKNIERQKRKCNFILVRMNFELADKYEASSIKDGSKVKVVMNVIDTSEIPTEGMSWVLGSDPCGRDHIAYATDLTILETPVSPRR